MKHRSFHELNVIVLTTGVQPHLCRTGGTDPRARPDHDRCHPPQGAPDGGKPLKRGALPRCIGLTKGGLNSKLHAVCDGEGRPIVMMLTEGQMSDHKSAVLLFDALPCAKELLGDKGYDGDWFRASLTARGITPCIPPKSNRNVQYHNDKAVYKSATWSKTCSPKSRTGAASTPAMLAAHTP
jgi:transposase